MRQSSDIRYTIHGYDQQSVEVTLRPSEAITAENGTMMFFEPGIQMDTRISDGSVQHSGLLGRWLGAFKRKIGGENFFLSYFENKASQEAKIALASPFPGQIVPIDLSYCGGHILCQQSAYLCSARGVSIDVGFTKRLSSGFFGGEGFILQSLKGDGIAFLHAGGSVIERTLQAGEKLYVDTGSIVAFESSVDFNIQVVRGVKNMMFGGEALFLTTLTGPGKVWIQSLPTDRLIANLKTKLSVRTRKSSK